MAGEADEFPLARARGHVSGRRDAPAAGAQDPGLLKGSQLRPRTLRSTPRFGGDGHGGRICGGSEDFGSAGSRCEGRRKCVQSEEMARRWFSDRLPFPLYSGCYPPNQGTVTMITPKVTVGLLQRLV